MLSALFTSVLTLSASERLKGEGINSSATFLVLLEAICCLTVARSCIQHQDIKSVFKLWFKRTDKHGCCCLCVKRTKVEKRKQYTDDRRPWTTIRMLLDSTRQNNYYVKNPTLIIYQQIFPKNQLVWQVLTIIW